MWEHFECKTFGDYHDLYLLTDVLLLADVMENFRDMVMEFYGLDPAHYISLPMLSWDAMLKTRKEVDINRVPSGNPLKLELLTDADACSMVEKAQRVTACVR